MKMLKFLFRNKSKKISANGARHGYSRPAPYCKSVFTNNMVDDDAGHAGCCNLQPAEFDC